MHKLTTGPANLLNLDQGRLTPGSPADIILFDPDKPWVVKSEMFLVKVKIHLLITFLCKEKY